MTSGHASPVRQSALIGELLYGRSGHVPAALWRSFATTATSVIPPAFTGPVASIGFIRPVVPLRLRKPLLPIFDIMMMSAGVDRSAEPTAGVADSASAARITIDADPDGQPNPRADGSSESMSPDRSQASDEPGADPDDLHRLVVEHSDAIYRLALSVVRDRALAEDVAQEALVKAWLALPSFRGEASLRGWLLRITHNTAISTLRRRRAVVLDPQDLPERQTRVDRSVESRVQGHVVMDEFVDALDTLDELSRSIVVLRELEGLSYEEISEVLAVPMPTVKTRLLRARRRLGNVLRDWA